MIRLYLKNAVLLTAVAAAAYGLAAEFGPWPAVLACSAVAAVACAAGRSCSARALSGGSPGGTGWPGT